MGALDLLAKAAKGVKNAPFFSKADVVLDELQRGKGTGDEFLTELVKKGVKPTELKDRGLDKALKGKPKMTKAEVQKVFQEKAPPRVRDEIRGGYEYQRALDEKAQEMIGDENVGFDDLYGRDKDRAEAAVRQEYGYDPETKYGEYVTPGGTNYREILLKIPQRGLNEIDKRNLMLYEGDIRRGKELDPWHQKQFAALKEKEAAGSQDYQSVHFKDTPNILAHIRVQDFTTPEGKKVLLVDEVQSDWHQAGRKRGYREGFDRDSMKDEMKDMIRERGALVKEFMEYQAKHGDITPEMQAKWNEFKVREDALEQKKKEIAAQVPDAPFKKNWHELAMKRVLDYATENGYDTVAITPGAEQAKRYDLSKQIKDVHYNQQKGVLVAYDLKGNQVIRQEGIDPNKVEDFVGKEVAGKLLSAPPEASGYSTLSGLDLQVGGEGMKGFYDKILPDYLNNYGKQYGAQTGQISLRTPSEKPWNIEDAARFHGMSGADYLDNPNRSQLEKQFLESRDNQTTGFHSFDITPQMREEIKTKGQPMYGKVAMPALEGLAAGSGAATMGSQMFDENNEQSVQNPVHFTENPDAMLLELMQRN